LISRRTWEHPAGDIERTQDIAMAAHNTMHRLGGHALYGLNILTWPLFPVLQGVGAAVRWLRLKLASTATN
jgi:hypothetical protein